MIHQLEHPTVKVVSYTPAEGKIAQDYLINFKYPGDSVLAGEFFHLTIDFVIDTYDYAQLGPDQIKKMYFQYLPRGVEILRDTLLVLEADARNVYQFTVQAVARRTASALDQLLLRFVTPYFESATRWWGQMTGFAFRITPIDGHFPTNRPDFWREHGAAWSVAGSSVVPTPVHKPGGVMTLLRTKYTIPEPEASS